MQTEEPKKPKDRTITPTLSSFPHTYTHKSQKFDIEKEEEGGKVRWEDRDTGIEILSLGNFPDSSIENLKEEKKRHLSLKSLRIMMGGAQSSSTVIESMDSEKKHFSSPVTSSGSSSYNSRFSSSTTSIENGQSNIFQSNSGNMEDSLPSPRIKNAEGSYLNNDEMQISVIADKNLKNPKSRRSISISQVKKDKKSKDEEEKKQTVEKENFLHEPEKIWANTDIFFQLPEPLLTDMSISRESSTEKNWHLDPIKKPKASLEQDVTKCQHILEASAVEKESILPRSNRLNSIKRFSLHSKKSENLMPGEKEYQIGMELFLSCQYPQAFSCFEKSAAKEYPSAFVWLSIFAGSEFVGKTDKTESEKWYKKAAAKIEWFEEKAKMGCLDSQNNLGFLYALGIGVEKDEKKSFFYYKSAANKGFVLAQLNLGMCYQDGRGVRQNHTEAVKYFHGAAEQGNAMAQYQLGMCYLSGNGVIQDYKMAAECLQLSADQEYPNAQNELGLCYYNGKGITQDFQMAFRYFHLAAERGYPPAQKWLGFCYSKGDGITKDNKMAVKYYQLAAGQGDEGAKSLLKNLLINEPSLARKIFLGTPVNFYKASEDKKNTKSPGTSNKDNEKNSFLGRGKNKA